MKNQNGFTLIELMIVVLIIGILANFAISSFHNYSARTRVSEGLTLASSVKTSVQDYYSAEGVFPVDNDAAGIAVPSDFATDSVESITVSEATITVAFTSRVHSAPKNTLTLVADSSGGNLSWNCTGGELPDRFRPSTCR